MLNTREEIKSSYLGSGRKNLILRFDDGTVIDNDDIALESLEIEHSISDGAELLFGNVTSACFKTMIKGTTKRYKGLWFNASLEFDGHEIKLGRFLVDEDLATTDHKYREIVAYDELHSVMNMNVAIWYNRQKFPVSQKELRDDLFSYIGIEQVEIDLPNDELMINKTIESEQIDAIKVLKAICELNACFGVINNDGKFKYVFLKHANRDTLFPSEDLYPSEELFPKDAHSEHFGKHNIHMGTLKYEEYKVKEITQVIIRQDAEDLGASAGYSTNTYVIEDNLLTGGLDDATIRETASKFLQNASYVPYQPCSFRTYGRPWLEVGDIVCVHTDDGCISMPILHRIFRGIISPKDEFSAKGSETYQEVVKDSSRAEIKRLKSTTNKLTRTIEETRSEITKIEEAVDVAQSSIVQNAEKIELKVSKGDVSSSISQESDQIVINGNRFILNASNIQIDANGNVEIKGKLTTKSDSIIGGFKTNENSIYNGEWNAQRPPNVFMCTGSETVHSLGGSEPISGWALGCYPNFGVTQEGYVYASGAKFTDPQDGAAVAIKDPRGGIGSSKMYSYKIEIFDNLNQFMADTSAIYFHGEEGDFSCGAFGISHYDSEGALLMSTSPQGTTQSKVLKCERLYVGTTELTEAQLKKIIDLIE